MVSKSFLTVDVHQWSIALQKVAGEALPKAARDTVNDAAFRAQREMPVALEEALDRPSAFTLRSFAVRKAEASKNLSLVTSTLYAKPIQSEYLRYVIFGGERQGGDKAAWKKDVPMTPEDHENALGSLPRGLSKSIKKARDAEKALRGQGQQPKAVGKFQGYFFARLGGVLGYYKRPARKKLVGPKRKGVIRWANLGPPDLMIAVYDHVQHRAKFRAAYDQVIDNARLLAVAGFPENLARQMAKSIGPAKLGYASKKGGNFLK